MGKPIDGTEIHSITYTNNYITMHNLLLIHSMSGLMYVRSYCITVPFYFNLYLTSVRICIFSLDMISSLQ